MLSKQMYSPRLDFTCLTAGQSIKRVNWVGIQWRADDLIFDSETYPNYQKWSKFTNKSTTGAQNLRA